jgi:hypothetical protein
MGNMMTQLKGTIQGTPKQGAVISPPSGQQQQPGQYRPPPVQMQQPGQYGPSPIQMQQPGQYGPPAVQMQQPIPYSHGQSYPYGSSMPGYPGPPPVSYPYNQNQNQNQSSPNENDFYLSNLTGLHPVDIVQLRREFSNYTNSYGVIDREGFRKLYIASLLNTTWEIIAHDSEVAFRNFDVHQTGGLDFNEYITACSHIMKEHA